VELESQRQVRPGFGRGRSCLFNTSHMVLAVPSLTLPMYHCGSSSIQVCKVRTVFSSGYTHVVLLTSCAKHTATILQIGVTVLLYLDLLRQSAASHALPSITMPMSSVSK